MGTFNWTPEVFVGATPHQFWDVYEGIRASRHDESSESQFMSRSELDDLMARVPDKPRKR